MTKTHRCIKASKSSADIDNCKSLEQKRVLSYIHKKDEKNTIKFYSKKEKLINKYEVNRKKTKVKNKEYILSKAIQCLQNSKNELDINKCKNLKEKSINNFLLSFNDNPRLRNLSKKDDLIDRYKVRLELARLNRLYYQVSVFSKTLKCFKQSKSKKDLDYCKQGEANRIVKLIRS